MNHCFDGVKSASAEALERATRSRGKATVLDLCVLTENRRREPTICIAFRRLLGISTIGRADDATSKRWVPAAHILDQSPTSDDYARLYTSVFCPHAKIQAGSFHTRASVVDSRDTGCCENSRERSHLPPCCGHYRRCEHTGVGCSSHDSVMTADTLGWAGRLSVLLSLRCHDSRQPTPGTRMT